MKRALYHFAFGIPTLVILIAGLVVLPVLSFMAGLLVGASLRVAKESLQVKAAEVQAAAEAVASGSLPDLGRVQPRAAATDQGPVGSRPAQDAAFRPSAAPLLAPTSGVDPDRVESPPEQAVRREKAFQEPAPAAGSLRVRDLEAGLDRPPAPLPVTAGASAEDLKPTTSGSFAVQVGAFLVERNAGRLMGNLRKKGYVPSLYLVYDRQNRLWYQVWIGTYEDREAAFEAAEAFAEKEHMRAVVRGRRSL